MCFHDKKKPGLELNMLDPESTSGGERSGDECVLAVWPTLQNTDQQKS